MSGDAITGLVGTAMILFTIMGISNYFENKKEEREERDRQRELEQKAFKKEIKEARKKLRVIVDLKLSSLHTAHQLNAIEYSLLTRYAKAYLKSDWVKFGPFNRELQYEGKLNEFKDLLCRQEYSGLRPIRRDGTLPIALKNKYYNMIAVELEQPKTGKIYVVKEYAL